MPKSARAGWVGGRQADPLRLPMSSSNRPIAPPAARPGPRAPGRAASKRSRAARATPRPSGRARLAGSLGSRAPVGRLLLHQHLAQLRPAPARARAPAGARQRLAHQRPHLAAGPRRAEPRPAGGAARRALGWAAGRRHDEAPLRRLQPRCARRPAPAHAAGSSSGISRHCGRKVGDPGAGRTGGRGEEWDKVGERGEKGSGGEGVGSRGGGGGQGRKMRRMGENEERGQDLGREDGGQGCEGGRERVRKETGERVGEGKGLVEVGEGVSIWGRRSKD